MKGCDDQQADALLDQHHQAINMLEEHGIHFTALYIHSGIPPHVEVAGHVAVEEVLAGVEVHDYFTGPSSRAAPLTAGTFLHFAIS